MDSLVIRMEVQHGSVGGGDPACFADGAAVS